MVSYCARCGCAMPPPSGDIWHITSPRLNNQRHTHLPTGTLPCKAKKAVSARFTSKQILVLPFGFAEQHRWLIKLPFHLPSYIGTGGNHEALGKCRFNGGPGPALSQHRVCCGKPSKLHWVIILFFLISHLSQTSTLPGLSFSIIHLPD